MDTNGKTATDLNMDTLAETVGEIVRDVGRVMCEAPDVEIYTKEGHTNYTTEMDIRIQKLLVERLQGLIPDAVFILEEEQDGIPPLGEYTWIIDPIDGTQNFINNYRCSSISIALLHKTTGILGVVYNPFADELFCGIHGRGAFLNKRPIHVSDKPYEAAVICFGTALYYRDLSGKSMAVATRLFEECCDLRRSGSAALDLCYVACGRCDGMFELRVCPWDYAGGAIVLMEAGGRVDAVAPATWDYTQKLGVVGANPVIFDRVKKTIDEIVAER